MNVVCLVCNKLLSSQSSLNRHRREVHDLESSNIEYSGSLFNYKCLEENCTSSFIGSSHLRVHLREKHNIDDELIEMQFECYKDFQKWLSNEERDSHVQFFKGTGTKKSQNSLLKRSYFYCFRSGHQPDIAENPKRFPKSGGSCRTNKYCTSTITVNEDINTGKCFMKYYKRHYGHEKEIKYLRVNKLDKEVVASKLILGIPASKILSAARETVGNTLSRSNIITRKDIQNIATEYNLNLQDGCRHADDATSVNIWVNQCLENENNPVLYYKKQGEICSEFNLLREDFCLIIMDKIQSDLLKDFGSKFIAIDSTHGMNAYDFELTTILSVDEFHEGIPLAFMFSNRKDSFINHVFFKKIRDRLGPIQTDIFMSDITNVFVNPWEDIMTHPAKHLYCSWHIDRAWQSNLSKITNSEKREWVYKTLKYLQTLLDEEKFQEGLTHFLNILNDDTTSKFREYFVKYYANICDKWAYCFRTKSVANTNMHLESMHKTLKYYYLQGKKIKRLDKTIHVLMDFLKNKKFERIIKLTKGNPSALINNIRARHRVAITTKFNVEFLDSNIFAVSCNSSKDKHTVVQNFNEDKMCCPIVCSICHICLHTYTCTCLDFNIRTVICKHIHYIALNYFKSSLNANIITTTAKRSKEHDFDNVVDDLASSSACKSKLSDEIMSRALSLVQKIKTRESEYSADQLKHILENIKNAERISDIHTTNFETKRESIKEPANKKICKQSSFFSTRNKNKNKNCTRKPNIEDTEIITETLFGTSSSVMATADHCYL